MAVYVILLALGGLIGTVLWRRHKGRLRREGLIARGLSPEEWRIMTAAVPLLRRLPPELHRPLEGKVSLFLGQVEFIGCNDLEVTDEIALSVAAQACLLVLNNDRWYHNLTTVLVYPGAFKSLRKDYDGYVVREHEVVRSGESWSRGPVILSWADSAQGTMNTEDGVNVVLHEFAHQFDDSSGHTDGAPLMNPGQSLQDWVRVFGEAFERHVLRVEHRRATVLDAYGAQSPEEFFAVAVEAFFERPEPLHESEPEVYDQLTQLFRLDPRNWA